MKVQELMTTSVSVCGLESNLAEAAGLMWERDCGMLPVVAEDGKAIGAITDRDICMALATQNRLASEIKVKEAMSEKIRVCRATDDVKNALLRQNLIPAPNASHWSHKTPVNMLYPVFPSY
jgi:predicted transcriptional regulator